MKVKWFFFLLALAVHLTEGIWLLHYLSEAVELGDERLGAYFLLAGTLSWLLAAWWLLWPVHSRKRTWSLVFLGALLLYFAYVFLTRHW